MPEEEKKQEEEAEEEEEEREVSDRTKEQFEKLTESNKELKTERDKYKNVLESLVPEKPEDKYQEPTNKMPSAGQYKNLEQKDIESVFKSMVDEDGYLDGNVLLTTLKKMDERTRRAEQEAIRLKKEQERLKLEEEQKQISSEAKMVHEKYPQLDPENEEEFNKDFYNAVRGDLINDMMKSGKRDFMKSADRIAKAFVSSSKEEKEVATKEETKTKEETQKKKEQINAVRPKSTSMAGYYKDEEEQALREKVRKGKKGALAEMLRRREEKNK